MDRNLLDVLFGALAVWLIWKHILRPKAQSLKSKIKDYGKHLQHLYNMNSDVYGTELNEILIAEIQACKDIRKEKDKVILSTFYKESQTKLKEKIPSKKYEALADNLDVLLVAFSLAFAVRALFLQPFKIPTSSMQPTLHGVNVYNGNRNDPKTIVGKKGQTQLNYFTHEMKLPSAGEHGKLRNFLDALYYGQTYMDVKSPSTGPVTHHSASIKETVQNKLGIPLLQSFSKLEVAGAPVYIPVPHHKVNREYKDNQFSLGSPLKNHYNSGSTVFKGICEDGDHLFVNRIVYNFRNPQRGDIAVFMTKGIIYGDGGLPGQFYIKRLIGIPGDTLRIKRNNRIYLMVEGKEIPLSGKHHHSFDKIYSGKNGYHGHWMSIFNYRDGERTESPYNDALQVIDTSGNSKEENITIVYHGNQYQYDGEKFLNSSKSFHFTKEKDTITYISNREKKVFKKTDNSYNWTLVSILRNDGYEVHYNKEYEDYKLSDNQYFMMGDNSASSLDSRYWGPVPRKNIIGTAMSVFWPFSRRWGFADNFKPLDKETVIPGRF